jgi:sortase (surface protein transpeptidase)
VRGSLCVWALLCVVIALLGACAPETALPTTRAPAVATAPVRAESPTPALVKTPPVETPPDVTSTPAPTAALTTAPAATIATLPRITIPRLGIALFIKEGDVVRDIDDQHTPENYAFHLPGTLMPGEGGNSFLYAHARVGMFLSLWNARAGDNVFVTAPDGRVLAYVVRDVFARVAPTDVSSTLPTTVERLTLQTSTGPNPSDPRFVVFAFPRGG